MEWCGRAPAPPANDAWMGRPTEEHRNVQQDKFDCYHDGHRHRQERVPSRRPRPARRDRAAAEVVARPGRSTAREYAAVSDRDGGLCWRPSPEPQTAIARSRCTFDAGEIRAALFEGAEE